MTAEHGGNGLGLPKLKLKTLTPTRDDDDADSNNNRNIIFVSAHLVARWQHRWSKQISHLSDLWCTSGISHWSNPVCPLYC